MDDVALGWGHAGGVGLTAIWGRVMATRVVGVNGHCCIEPKDVIATVQTSKAGSTIPVKNHDNPGI